MNIPLAIFGLLIVVLSFIIGPSSKAVKPADGDVQIRKQGQTYWIYQWNEEPGWKLVGGESGEESAKRRRDDLEERAKQRRAYSEPEEIIK